MAGPPCNPRHAVMMKKALVFALVAAVCVGCRPPAGESPSFDGGMRRAAITHPAAAAVGVIPDSASPTRRVSFASLSDRGDLVAYSALTPPRVDGAYTWHRTQISEAHAFQSIRSGSMRITSPSGRPLDFDYVRHVEHPSGDWTWVGRLKDGASSDEAVVTFGERAVFGSIADPGKPAMRLTTMHGSAWLVETDAAKVAAIQNEATRPTSPDYFLPPQQVAALGAESSGSASAALAPSTAGAVSAAAAVTVDVVVGYTSGFAASLGGQSQAVTRLNNMVEIANQAYVNSQVDAAIRMVHSLQVDYPDNTANGTTLESLTGYRSGSGQIPVDPAFAALRAARDQYGGDLVTLVRKFQTPENDGCGIAWLIGGGRTGLDTGDAPFGYSVVSDGVDAGTDGKNYFCRPETLAHELGHNMGSQHDRATATDNGTLSYGVFAYSFGYKTGVGSGNFYTVMAYGDTGQVAYRVFSNPRITFCGGYACGISGESDNAMSLGNTMPTVAAFRATSVPVAQRARNDINGDGRSDLLWHNPSAGRFGYWIMSGPTVMQMANVPVALGYRIAATGDFDGDNLLDLVWTSNAGDLWLWSGSGSTSFASSYLGSYSDSWAVIGAGDINNDNRDDLLWHNPAQGRFGFWLMNGPNVLQMANVPVTVGYRVPATGDFNGDGFLDVMWTSNAGDLWLWSGNGTAQFSSTRIGQYGSGWRPIGSGDANADGTDDLVWHNDLEGRFGYWLMNGPSVLTMANIPVTRGYRVAAAGDYNGDSRLDVVWTSEAADIWLWSGNGSGSFASNFLGNYSGGWQLVDANLR